MGTHLLIRSGEDVVAPLAQALTRENASAIRSLMSPEDAAAFTAEHAAALIGSYRAAFGDPELQSAILPPPRVEGNVITVDLSFGRPGQRGARSVARLEVTSRATNDQLRLISARVVRE